MFYTKIYIPPQHSDNSSNTDINLTNILICFITIPGSIVFFACFIDPILKKCCIKRHSELILTPIIIEEIPNINDIHDHPDFIIQNIIIEHPDDDICLGVNKELTTINEN